MEKEARSAWDALREKPSSGAIARLLPKTLPRDVKDRGKKLAEDVEKRLAAPPAIPAPR